MMDRPRPCPNWFEMTARDLFSRHLTKLVDTRCRCLQIGVYAGDASMWILDHLPLAVLVDVDTWRGSAEHDPMGIDFRKVEAYYDARTEPHWGRLLKFKMTSRSYLAMAPDLFFDFVYIDGDHDPVETLADALGAFRLLRPGGLICFDDNLWTPPGGGRGPGHAVDAFRHVMGDRIGVLEVTSQAWFEKLR